VLANVLLLPGVFPISPIITVAWSLSFEIFFYLGIATLVTLLALRRWPRSLRVALILFMVAVWLLIEPVRSIVGSFYMFLPGLLLYEIVSDGNSARVMRPVISAMVLLGFATSIIVEPYLSHVAISRNLAPASEWGSVTLAPLSLLVLSVGIGALLVTVIRFHSDVGRILGSGLVRHVGLVSYSFYLVHGLTINGVALLGNALLGSHRLAPHAVIYFALMPIVYLVCVGTATLLFRTVEKRYSF
jgi:peptidoglycan/LPS O-acetylase OafA/YrhL